MSEIEKRRSSGELRPVTGGQWVWRGCYAAEHAGSTWTVEVDYFDIGEKIKLYRDGRLVDSGREKVTFKLPEGATIEAAMALYGMSRAHLVVDGKATRLTPVKGTAEHSRMVFAKQHPGWSTTISVISFLVLFTALVLQVPQWIDWITHTGWWPHLSSWQFSSPISMPGWANGLWTAAGVLAGLERGLSMRHHSLLDE